MGKRAMVEVIFAARASSPVSRSAGKVRKDPPPAKVLTIPAINEAAANAKNEKESTRPRRKSKKSFNRLAQSFSESDQSLIALFLHMSYVPPGCRSPPIGF